MLNLTEALLILMINRTDLCKKRICWKGYPFSNAHRFAFLLSSISQHRYSALCLLTDVQARIHSESSAHLYLIQTPENYFILKYNSWRPSQP